MVPRRFLASNRNLSLKQRKRFYSGFSSLIVDSLPAFLSGTGYLDIACRSPTFEAKTRVLVWDLHDHKTRFELSLWSKPEVPKGRFSMYQNNLASLSSCTEHLKNIEADIHHANSLAAAIQQVYGGARIQMRLSYNSLAPVLFFLVQWLEIACIYNLPSYLGLLDVLVYKVYVDGKSGISSYGRRAGLREFYGPLSIRIQASFVSLGIAITYSTTVAESIYSLMQLAGVIYPSLQQLGSSLTVTDDSTELVQMDGIFGRPSEKGCWRVPNKEQSDREDECGICLDTCSKMVLPNCNHSMCINCYHDWNTRSESCPFCRGSLKRVSSSDLWVLTSNGDVIDPMTVLKENLRHFYLYINNLPLAIPDSLFVGFYEYLI